MSFIIDDFNGDADNNNSSSVVDNTTGDGGVSGPSPIDPDNTVMNIRGGDPWSRELFAELSSGGEKVTTVVCYGCEEGHAFSDPGAEGDFEWRYTGGTFDASEFEYFTIDYLEAIDETIEPGAVVELYFDDVLAAQSDPLPDENTSLKLPLLISDDNVSDVTIRVDGVEGLNVSIDNAKLVTTFEPPPFTLIEAEDLELVNYRVEDNDFASGGALISLLGAGPSGTTGTASGEFTGPSGLYDIVVGYFDDNDGDGLLRFRVNHDSVDNWSLDQDLGSNLPNAQTFQQRTIGGVELNTGDTLTIQGTSDFGDFARVDFFKLLPRSVFDVDSDMKFSNSTFDPTNPFDPGVPGFVGPDGPGKVTEDNFINPIFVGFATGVEDYSPAPGVIADFSDPNKALGEVTAEFDDVVSLGELSQEQIDAGVAPGQITLTFDVTIGNGKGADFAVFENGFDFGGGTFAELAYVEVSTDGSNFARFPSISLTSEPVDSFGVVDSTEIFNLAGKHVNNAEASGDSFGTPFDLEDLSKDSLVKSGLLDLNEINFVRLVDIPGSGDFPDAKGNPIFDPFPQSPGGGGFDLEAIGVINEV